MRSAVAALGFFLVLFLSIAFLGSTLICKSYWGYWFAPPRIDSRVTEATKVIGCGGFDADWQNNRYKQGNRYKPVWSDIPTDSSLATPEPTEYPLAYDAVKIIQAGIDLRKQGKAPVTLTQINSMLSDKRIRVRSDKGYNAQERSRGFWMELEGSGKQKYLFISADGGQQSNDHYPHYRLLYTREPDGKLNLISHQIFYFDIAGMERASWSRIFLALGVLSIIGAVVAWGIYTSIERTRQPAS